jgi:hypothetical protein
MRADERGYQLVQLQNDIARLIGTLTRSLPLRTFRFGTFRLETLARNEEQDRLYSIRKRRYLCSYDATIALIRRNCGLPQTPVSRYKPTPLHGIDVLGNLIKVRNDGSVTPQARQPSEMGAPFEWRPAVAEMPLPRGTPAARATI